MHTSPSSSQPTTATPKLTLRGGVPHHPSLVALWRDERLTDFVVCAEGVEFKAHRIVLASSSGYFLTLFESNMRDAADATHAIQGIRPAALEALLAFVYEGACEIEEGLLTEVLEAAARLVVDALKQACADAIGARLTPSNALDGWRLADVFTLPALEKAALEAALRGFEELPVQLATGAEVLALVQDNRLVVKSEETVFRSCVQWWEAAERPEAELLAVMKHVRFAVMAEEFLRETVGAWPALQSTEVQSMLSNAVLPAVDGTKVVPRSGFGPRLIYVVGGSDEYDEMVSTMELYDLQNASWTQLASMAVPRSSHGCVALDGKLYAAGGQSEAEDIGSENDPAEDSAEVYDPQTDGWLPLAKMTTARVHLGLAAVGGKVYAIGGYGATGSALDSVEAYDPQLGCWALVASMSVRRMGPASVVLYGKIYVMGGHDHEVVWSSAFDSVEVYDPQADSWQRVASMPRGLSRPAAAVVGGKVYVTGGSKELCVYDPQADVWTPLASMSIALPWRPWHNASVAVDGKLYVFGGSNGALLSTAEVYDPASDSWAHGPSMTSARAHSVAVSL